MQKRNNTHNLLKLFTKNPVIETKKEPIEPRILTNSNSTIKTPFIKKKKKKRGLKSAKKKVPVIRTLIIFPPVYRTLHSFRKPTKFLLNQKLKESRIAKLYDDLLELPAKNVSKSEPKQNSVSLFDDLPVKPITRFRALMNQYKESIINKDSFKEAKLTVVDNPIRETKFVKGVYVKKGIKYFGGKYPKPRTTFTARERRIGAKVNSVTRFAKLKPVKKKTSIKIIPKNITKKLHYKSK